MHQRRRGWIMPEADMLSMLKLIDERVSSPEIDVRHRDALIRLRDTLEQDLYHVPLSQTHPMKAKAGRFGTQPTGSRYQDVVLNSNQIDPSLDELSTSKKRAA